MVHRQAGTDSHATPWTPFPDQLRVAVFSLTRYALGSRSCCPQEAMTRSSVASRLTRTSCRMKKELRPCPGQAPGGGVILGAVTAPQREFVPVKDLAVRFLLLPGLWQGDHPTCEPGDGLFLALFVAPARRRSNGCWVIPSSSSSGPPAGPSSSLRTIASSSSRSAKLEGLESLSSSVIALPHRWLRSVEQRRGVLAVSFSSCPCWCYPSFCHAVPGATLPRSVRD